ncbi:MAG TPA: hypothetical protein VL285_02465 [Bryobacteraceae bacterium]|jgi:hypothetical protein|nr:hypothetical protein [Bryobacteraceae bacterium]
MAGYLDRYGEGYAERAKRRKLVLIAVVSMIVATAGLYLALHNHRQKAQVSQFIQLLQKHDYKTAYTLWGCSDTKPCPEYSFDKFMEDWGPKSQYGQIASFDIARSKACGSGVIVTVELGQKQERLWVEGDQLTIGYSPWSVCPAR